MEVAVDDLPHDVFPADWALNRGRVGRVFLTNIKRSGENNTSGFHLVDYFNGAYEHLAASHDVSYWIPVTEAGRGSSWQREAGTR